MSAAVLAFLPDTWFAWIPGLRSVPIASELPEPSPSASS
jgi:hypothetical protein